MRHWNKRYESSLNKYWYFLKNILNILFYSILFYSEYNGQPLVNHTVSYKFNILKSKTQWGHIQCKLHIIVRNNTKITNTQENKNTNHAVSVFIFLYIYITYQATMGNGYNQFLDFPICQDKPKSSCVPLFTEETIWSLQVKVQWVFVSWRHAKARLTARKIISHICTKP